MSKGRIISGFNHTSSYRTYRSWHGDYQPPAEAQIKLFVDSVAELETILKDEEMSETIRYLRGLLGCFRSIDDRAAIDPKMKATTVRRRKLQIWCRILPFFLLGLQHIIMSGVYFLDTLDPNTIHPIGLPQAQLRDLFREVRLPCVLIVADAWKLAATPLVEEMIRPYLHEDLGAAPSSPLDWHRYLRLALAQNVLVKIDAHAAQRRQPNPEEWLEAKHQWQMVKRVRAFYKKEGRYRNILPARLAAEDQIEFNLRHIEAKLTDLGGVAEMEDRFKRMSL